MKHKDHKSKKATRELSARISESKYRYMANRNNNPNCSMDNFRRPPYGKLHKETGNNENEER